MENTLNKTPSANRTHIGFFGRMNAGKSSIVNSFTGQSVSIVSDMAGTTTDVVTKSMEIHVPKQMTTPIGDQSALRLIIIGTTPMEAAADVRKIGRIRRLPASNAASYTLFPSTNRRCSA